MVFDNFDDFENYAKNAIQNCGDEYLRKVKEKGKQIIQEKILNAYSPSVYQRIGEILDSLDTEKKPDGNGVMLIVKGKEDIHSPSNWIGKNYPLDEIVFDYFKRNHIYKNGKHRSGVDVQEELEEYAFGEALQILYNELQKVL